MARSLFLQNVIAIVWDFDKTLTPGYMQEPLFRRFGVDASVFWKEVGGLADYYRAHGLEIVAPDSLYLNHILTYVQEGRFPGLTNALLRGLGGELTFYAGVPEIFGALTERLRRHEGAQQHDIKLEHYVVSTGLRQMILGSAVAGHVNGVWGCEFIESVPAPGYLEAEAAPHMGGQIRQVGYALDNTTKTRAIFEINKGTNVFREIDVNSYIALEDRRVPFQNIIYVADGPSDVPVFSVVRGQGGRTYAVYKPGSEKELAQVNQLLMEGRIMAFGEANFVAGSQTSIWLGQAVDQIADRITEDRNEVLESKVGKPPRHITE